VKVLVTGGTGGLGRPLVRALLRDGCSVRVLSRKARPESIPSEVEWVQADITSGDGLDAAVPASRRSFTQRRIRDALTKSTSSGRKKSSTLRSLPGSAISSLSRSLELLKSTMVTIRRRFQQSGSSSRVA
jgi:NAD(P)-dependent dehydrogenase (short-subunit alcohol dehydrogenase family)